MIIINFKKPTMKSLLISACLLLFFTFNLSAQVPQGIPYQAAARTSNGQAVLNAAIKVRFSIIDSAATGALVYKETHSVSTNNVGMFSVNIGMGTPDTGVFSGINWAKNFKFIKVEIDPSGSGSSFADMGTQQMMAVPYSFYSATSGSTAAPSGSNSNTLLFTTDGF